MTALRNSQYIQVRDSIRNAGVHKYGLICIAILGGCTPATVARPEASADEIESLIPSRFIEDIQLSQCSADERRQHERQIRESIRLAVASEYPEHERLDVILAERSENLDETHAPIFGIQSEIADSEAAAEEAWAALKAYGDRVAWLRINASAERHTDFVLYRLMCPLFNGEGDSWGLVFEYVDRNDQLTGGYKGKWFDD